MDAGTCLAPKQGRSINHHAKDALTIGLPAAGGAVVGALIDGKKGAGIGAAVGGGAGTAAVLTTRGKNVRVGGGAILSVRLASPLTVRLND